MSVAIADRTICVNNVMHCRNMLAFRGQQLYDNTPDARESRITSWRFVCYNLRE